MPYLDTTNISSLWSFMVLYAFEHICEKKIILLQKIHKTDFSEMDEPSHPQFTQK